MQAGLSLCGSHKSRCRFCCALAHFFFNTAPRKVYRGYSLEVPQWGTSIVWQHVFVEKWGKYEYFFVEKGVLSRSVLNSYNIITYSHLNLPWWSSLIHVRLWMEGHDSINTESGNILSRRLIVKCFVWSFPSTDSSRAVVNFLWMNVHKYWLTA